MITRLEADEWALFRTLRLAALEDTPDAFSPTHAETERHGADYWMRAARRFAVEPDRVLLIARPELGLMSAVRDDHGVGHIGAMWVAPAARGRGLGAALLDAGLRFLEERGVTVVELSVTETNTGAMALYRSRGFECTGESEPLRAGSPLANLFMRRSG